MERSVATDVVDEVMPEACCVGAGHFDQVCARAAADDLDQLAVVRAETFHRPVQALRVVLDERRRAGQPDRQSPWRPGDDHPDRCGNRSGSIRSGSIPVRCRRRRRSSVTVAVSSNGRRCCIPVSVPGWCDGWRRGVTTWRSISSITTSHRIRSRGRRVRSWGVSCRRISTRLSILITHFGFGSELSSVFFFFFSVCVGFLLFL